MQIKRNRIQLRRCWSNKTQSPSTKSQKILPRISTRTVLTISTANCYQIQPTCRRWKLFKHLSEPLLFLKRYSSKYQENPATCPSLPQQSSDTILSANQSKKQQRSNLRLSPMQTSIRSPRNKSHQKINKSY